MHILLNYHTTMSLRNLRRGRACMVVRIRKIDFYFFIFFFLFFFFFFYLWYDVGKSVSSRTYDISSFLFDWSAHSQTYVFAENLIWIPWFQRYCNWRILKTLKKTKEIHFFLTVSHNQCSRLPTDSARLQHKSVLNIIVMQFIH